MARAFHLFWLLAVSLALAACHSGDGGHSAALYADDSKGDDWPGYGRTYGEQHFSPLAEINQANVGQLGLAWSMDLPPRQFASPSRSRSTACSISPPGSASSTRSMRSPASCCGSTIPRCGEARGHEAARRLGHPRHRLVERQDLCRHPGRPADRDRREDRQAGLERPDDRPEDDGRYITGAPRVFDGKVIIGHGGADAARSAAMSPPMTPRPASSSGASTPCPAIRRRRSRTRPWRWPPRPGPANGGSSAAAAPCGTPSPTIRRATRSSSAPATAIRGTTSIRSAGQGRQSVPLLDRRARRARPATTSGTTRSIPARPGTTTPRWTSSSPTSTIDGKPRKVLMQAPKNGFFYVIDRTNGKLISAEPYAKVTWASRIDLATGRPVETPGARYPGRQAGADLADANGAHSWMPMASARRPAWSISPRSASACYKDIDYAVEADHRPLGRWRGDDHGRAGQRHAAVAGSLLAWNPVTQKPVWRVAASDLSQRRRAGDRRQPRLPGHGRRAVQGLCGATPASSCGSSTRARRSSPRRSPTASAASNMSPS